MKTKLEKQPVWVERALQGVTYWMGHRRCLYRDYPLSEGALVAEACNLIYANLPEKFQLLCEIQYSVFVEGNPLPEILQGKIRADLVVAERSARRGGDPIPKFIIEVKRASAPTSQINADLSRLAAVRRICPDIRVFMFVISEADRPKRFVNGEGHSILGAHPIPNCDGHYRVRRTWKAAHAFTRREHAQYACLIEVYPDPNKPKRRRHVR
jgi:hypothetical protein